MSQDPVPTPSFEPPASAPASDTQAAQATPAASAAAATDEGSAPTIVTATTLEAPMALAGA